jgi:hypothetical protein
LAQWAQNKNTQTSSYLCVHLHISGWKLVNKLLKCDMNITPLEGTPNCTALISCYP